MWMIRIVAILVLIWGIAGSLVEGRAGTGPAAGQWRDLVIAGIAQGFMYGLIALGYSMVYGVLGFINFAHGEVFMAGGMVGFFTANMLDERGMWTDQFVLSFVIIIVVAMVSSALVAVIVERVAYRRLRGAPRLIPLITSIGISFFLQYTFAGLFGATIRNYPQPPEGLRTKVDIVAGISVEGSKLVVIIVALISMAVLYLIVEKTKIGRSMRAVAEDKEIAALMGIDVDRTVVVTFAIGGAMAGIAGFLWAILFRGVSFITGFLPGIKAFTAAVLGGIGNIFGAMAGGVLLGVFEGVGPQLVLGGLDWNFKFLYIELLLLALVSFTYRRLTTAANKLRARRVMAALTAAAFLTLVIGPLRDLGLSMTVPGLSQLKDVVAFSALVLVLIFKPAGLFGERLSSEDRA